MRDIDLPALQIACRTLARQAFWSEKGTPEIPVAQLAGEFVRLANEQVVSVIESGRDPNIVTRAIAYLTHAHVVPSNGLAKWWFAEMLTCLLELAVPTIIHTSESGSFLHDVQKGTAELTRPTEKQEGTA